MSPDNIESNLAALRAALSKEEGFIEAPDQDYGRLFQFNFIPCCIPIPVLVWLNPKSEGIFVRVVFPLTVSEFNAPELYAALNLSNYSLPIGTFAANPSSGEVRFKSALFIGNQTISSALLSHLFASTGDMVRSNYKAVLSAITGVKHEH